MNSEEMIQELKKINNKIDKNNITVEKLLKWIRFDKMSKLKGFLQNTLTTDAEKIMFELTDGEASTRDIAAKCNVTHKTVGNYWQRWRVMGILESTDKYSGRRYKKICSLSELGIEIPILKNNAIDKTETEIKSDTEEVNSYTAKEESPKPEVENNGDQDEQDEIKEN